MNSIKVLANDQISRITDEIIPSVKLEASVAAQTAVYYLKYKMPKQAGSLPRQSLKLVKQAGSDVKNIAKEPVNMNQLQLTLLLISLQGLQAFGIIAKLIEAGLINLP